MSASTELLLEQITNLETTIQETEAAGQDASAHKKDLKALREKLARANTALNEGKAVLKG